MEMKKPNWVCSACSMWSNRKSSVKRHIENQHNGNASLVTFMDYIVGRQSGLYLPPPPPPPPASLQHSNYQNKEEESPVNTFTQEYMKEKARLAARKDMGLSL
jgi:hypothetical protein